MIDKTVDPRIRALSNRNVPGQYRRTILAAAGRTGIGAPGTRGDSTRLYVVELMAYYLGKGPCPIPPRELSTVGLERWAKRRAWHELEEEASHLPAMRLELEPEEGAP